MDEKVFGNNSDSVRKCRRIVETEARIWGNPYTTVKHRKGIPPKRPPANGTVRMDTCKICDSLKIKSRSKVSSLAKEVKTELDVYHRKVEEVFKTLQTMELCVYGMKASQVEGRMRWLPASCKPLIVDYPTPTNSTVRRQIHGATYEAIKPEDNGVGWPVPFPPSLHISPTSYILHCIAEKYVGALNMSTMNSVFKRCMCAYMYAVKFHKWSELMKISVGSRIHDMAQDVVEQIVGNSKLDKRFAIQIDESMSDNAELQSEAVILAGDLNDISSRRANIVCVSCMNECDSVLSPREGPTPTSQLLASRPYAEAEVDDHPTRMEKCVLRCTIFEMYDNGEYPTMKKIVALMKEKIQYQGSVTSMHTLLKSMGFNYKRTADSRKFLMERVDIVVARIKFLRAMHAITESGDNRPIFYLDETYVIKIIQEKKSGRTPKKQRSPCSYGQRQLTHCLSRQFCKNWEQMGLPFASSK
ncbi:hypothetical protein ANN_18922 [Periplaneta americana]|uniref:Winged helix-turn helix domain-containing protein n=1 Tax=Periplaneta americana TaxID=6978 RepID=A0ABQ8SRD9_PERAM|nr:hypothetical protein ANN_18922 [Periplaneta americana]